MQNNSCSGKHPAHVLKWLHAAERFPVGRVMSYLEAVCGSAIVLACTDEKAACLQAGWLFARLKAVESSPADVGVVSESMVTSPDNEFGGRKAALQMRGSLPQFVQRVLGMVSWAQYVNGKGPKGAWAGFLGSICE